MKWVALLPVLGIITVLAVSGCTSPVFGGPEAGIYVFKAVVCDAETCVNENSNGFYESTEFMLEISNEVCTGGCAGEGLNNFVTNFQKNLVKDNLKISEKRVVALSPESEPWKRGENGMYSIAIENPGYYDKNFSIYIFLENLGGALEGKSVGAYSDITQKWLSYNSTLFVGSGNIEFADVEIHPA